MNPKHLMILCFLFAAPLAAQTWEISGYIRSSGGEAVEGASVYVDDTTGVISNGDGFYRIVTPQGPKELIVQHLSHFSRRIILKEEQFTGRRLHLDVELTPQFMALPPVDIVSPKVQVLVEEDFSRDILDYEFAGPYLLLLIRERRQHVLRLTDESGTVLTELILAGTPRQLHRSCTGGLHAVGPDFTQELIVHALQLDTFPRYDTRKFRSIIEPCVLKNDRYYVFKKAELLNQAVRYWYFDHRGGRHPLTNVVNMGAVREAYSAYRSFMYNDPFVVRPEKTPQSDPMDKGFQLDAFADEYNMVLDVEALAPLAMSPSQNDWLGAMKTIEADFNYAPLFKIGDKILVFDHVDGEIRQFDDLFRPEKNIPIRYQRQKGWKKELLKDDVTQVLYAHFAPDGLHRLEKINATDGRMDQTYPLGEVEYLSHHFRIRDGYLYYLGQEDVNIPNCKLYKVHIAQQGKP